METIVQEVGEAEFQRAITRSVVGLGYTVQKPESTERTYQYASGFLLSIEDTWFFITAGHVLSDIERLKRAGWIIGQWHLDDTAGWRQAERCFIPSFTFKNEDTFVLESEKEHDYAAIRIKPFHRRELEANGKVALTEELWRPDWQSDALADIKAFCIVGVPGESVRSLETPGVFVVNKGLAFCEVIPLVESAVPLDYRRTTFSFYGLVADELIDEDKDIRLESIKGMSGGPIFALSITETGVLRTTVIAVQSAWYPNVRMVIGCPIRGFAEHLKVCLHTIEDARNSS
jgi:hypothetical protein